MGMYVNVAFPLKLPLLTYKAPSGTPRELRGRIVRAPLAGRSIFGVVMSVSEVLETTKEIRGIQEIYPAAMSLRTIAFLQWLADYYLCPVGTALRSSFFEEVVAIMTNKDRDRGPGTRDQGPEAGGRAVSSHPEHGSSIISAISTNISLNEYRSFLYHAESSNEERSLLISALTHLKDCIRNVIIAVPEIAHLEKVLRPIKDLFGDRVCVLHSKLTKKETRNAIRRIITDESDIVVGTRSAILAPLKQISFIAVSAEHSLSYKAEEGVRYNGRDIAVMRGFHERASVLLSSICPSVESVYNAEVGKYVMLKGQGPGIRDQGLGTRDQGLGTRDRGPGGRGQGPEHSERPMIKIVSLATGAGDRMLLAPDTLKEARKLSARKERFLFLVNRKGYSMLRCEECGHVERCKTCDVPLVFHKKEDVLRCHNCGFTGKCPASCTECGGTSIKAYGAGTEKVKEQVEDLLKAEALVVEKGGTAKRILSGNSPDLASLVIGTSYAKGLTYKGGADLKPFSAAAFLNMDAFLLRPDFRLYERAFQEIMAVAQLIGKEGTVFLQTRMPQNKVLRFIKSYDFDGFYQYELQQRKAFNNPPFTKLILFTLPVRNDQREDGRLLNEMERVAGAAGSGSVEVLGPVELPYHSKKYHHCVQVLLKSRDRSPLHDAAKSMLNELTKIKDTKVIVEVDPAKI